MASDHTNTSSLQTRVLPINTSSLGQFEDSTTLESWQLPASDDPSLTHLHNAANLLKTSNTPVAFPTETVYGLGADATRSSAVQGIYNAKDRPSDNPLIIHICDLSMLRELLAPADVQANGLFPTIPEVYRPLIQRFWPGPLTILLPNPTPSKLAPEVTAGLATFGVRMPSSSLAQSLIKIAGVPIAAPSANASGKPSCTTAAHVQNDLEGKIELIVDGGACQVGMESTIVDGLCDPPVILRPGGVDIESIREYEGWGHVVKGYTDQHDEQDNNPPRAPGMSYRHYSPRAKVVLYEPNSQLGSENISERKLGIPGLEVWRITAATEGNISHFGYENLDRQEHCKIGVITTKHWKEWAGLDTSKWADRRRVQPDGETPQTIIEDVQDLPTDAGFEMQQGILSTTSRLITENREVAIVYKIALGEDVKDIAHGLFSALRELDARDVHIIYVEGIEDEGDMAAAIMNRLRKAATVTEKLGKPRR